MDTIQEAFLMLGIDGLPQQNIDELKNTHWRLCGLVIHAFNVKSGLVCTGFDEDDPELDSATVGEGGILNLSPQFCADSRQIMTFRYQRKTAASEKETEESPEQFWLKIVPLNFDFGPEEKPNGGRSEGAKVQICLMSSKNNYKIFTHELKIGHLDLSGADKDKLDNLDSWAVQLEDGRAGKHLINQSYRTQILNKMLIESLKKKKEESKEDPPQSRFGFQPFPSNFNKPQPAPQNSGSGVGGIAPNLGNPYFTDGQRSRHIIGDDPLRVGGPRGGGVPGNLVGPNAGVFNPDGTLGGLGGLGGDPSLGGPGGNDIFPDFGSGQPRRGGFGGGNPGGFGGGFGGFGGGGGGFGGPMYG